MQANGSLSLSMRNPLEDTFGDITATRMSQVCQVLGIQLRQILRLLLLLLSAAGRGDHNASGCKTTALDVGPQGRQRNTDIYPMPKDENEPIK